MLFRFENFALDYDARELRRDGVVLKIEPKVFDLLAYLVKNDQRVVSRDDLISAVWDGRIVSESAVATCINAARVAIGDSGEQQRLIKTLTRKGIRFVGAIRREDDITSRVLPPGSGSSGSATALPLPERPSIAVLPFNNFSSDLEQEYFADGIVEDILSGLSRIKWLFVIARNSSFIYKGKSVDLKQVGRELGVRYVLEGGVRKSGPRVRITAQLIDAETGIHLWAERYDRSLEDIFALQDEITMCVVGAIEPSLRKAETERIKRQRPSDLNAYDLVLRSLRPFATGALADAVIAVPLLEAALKLEPDYALAHASLSWCHHVRHARGREHDPQDRIAAIKHANCATVHGSDDATALATAAFVLALEGREIARALKLFDRALDISSTNFFALSFSAVVLARLGQTQRAIEQGRLAIRLSPFDPLLFIPYHGLAVAHFHRQSYEEAADAAQNAVYSNSSFGLLHATLSAALLRLGRLEQAKEAAQRVLECEPSFTIRGASLTLELEPAVFGPLADAWRQAGLPEYHPRPA